MSRLFTLTLAGAAALGIAGAAISASHEDPTVAAAIKARQAHMQLYGFNLGKLGAMAKQEMEYDAGVAATAAANLDAMAHLDQAGYWVEGSDNFALDEGTRALPAIWEKPEDFQAKIAALAEATSAMKDAAGTDLAALQGAMGPLGQACGGCHKPYRQSDD